jgi:formylglycine-generating enzyme required for sulfatase activity
MITTLLLSLPIALLQAPEQRPGLVAIPGGQTLIGAEKDATIERIREMPASAAVLAGEIPRKAQRVDSFYISPTLVTNEMYLEFVNATGAMPPPAWATISKELRTELIQAGKKEFGPGYKFDEQTKAFWWSDHWQEEGRSWEMDSAIALEPVVSISFMDAEKYCAWAGVRIPTEQEWTRAARGDTSFDYPFGEEFDRKRISYAATQPSNMAYKLLPVCSMENASPYGIYDMVGLIHEFTDSRAVKLDGWKSFSVDLKDKKGKTTEKIYPSPSWDSSRILIKGGSYRNLATNCRIDTRIGFDRDASASIVGFRVAASAQPIVDSAYLRSQSLRSAVIGGTPSNILNYKMAIGVEKHSYRDLSSMEAKRAPHKEVKAVKLPDSYAVFGPHTSLSLTPLKDPFKYDDHRKLNIVDKNVRKTGRLIPVAALYTDVQLGDYNVPAGAYTLVYIPGMKKKDIQEWGGWVKGTERVIVEEVAAEEGDSKDKDAKKDDKKSKKSKKDKKADKKAKKVQPSVNIASVPLVPNRPHLLVVDSENVALAALPIVGKPAYAKEKKVPHGITFRKQEGDKKPAAILFSFRVPASSGNTYGFTIALEPKDETGASLCSPAKWDGVQN